MTPIDRVKKLREMGASQEQIEQILSGQEAYEQMAPGESTVEREIMRMEPSGQSGFHMGGIRQNALDQLPPPPGAPGYQPWEGAERQTRALSARGQEPPAQDFVEREVMGLPATRSGVGLPELLPGRGNMGGTPFKGYGGEEPYETAAALQPEEDARRRELENTRMWRAIAEGLGGIGDAALDYSAIRAGGENTRPRFVAEGLREQEMEQEDAIGPVEREMYRKYGVPIERGARRSQANLLLRAQRYGGRDAGIQGRFEQSLEARQRGLDIAEKGQQLRRESGLRPSEKAGRDVGDFDKTIELLEEIIVEKPKFNTGFYSDLAHRAGRYAPLPGSWQDPGYAGFRQKVLTDLNSYINNMTGKVMSQAEAGRLMDAMPTMKDDDAVFEEKAKTALGIVKLYRERYVTGIGQTGRNVSGFGDQIGRRPEADEEIDVIGPGGEEATALRSEIESGKYPDWRAK